MKRILPVFLALILLLGMVGCANQSENPDNSNTSKATDRADHQSQDSNKGERKNVLVVYYSATGTTEKAAEAIADYMQADLFVITPEKEYTSDDLNWRDDNSRVSVEHDHADSRDVTLVTTTPENFEDYDTIFIGYPIWWGIAAWPVDHFIKENDFTGKTVIPFCTAVSSDIGESGDLLAEMAGTGEWKQGRRFYGSSSESEIHSWLESLGY